MAGLPCPSMTTSAPPELLTGDDVARALGISARTVRRLAAAGELDRVRVGPGRRLVRYQPEDVVALVRRCRDEASST